MLHEIIQLWHELGVILQILVISCRGEQGREGVFEQLVQLLSMRKGHNVINLTLHSRHRLRDEQQRRFPRQPCMTASMTASKRPSRRPGSHSCCCATAALGRGRARAQLSYIHITYIQKTLRAHMHDQRAGLNAGGISMIWEDV